MTKGTVLVASPRAIGRMPEASGSSVPAWPAFLALSVRFTTATAWVEVMPTGLSSTIQPCTSRFLGRGSRAGGRSVTGSFIQALVIRLCDVPLNLLSTQQRVDASRLVEGLVAQEAQVGRELEVDPVRHLGAQ